MFPPVYPYVPSTGLQDKNCLFKTLNSLAENDRYSLSSSKETKKTLQVFPKESAFDD